MTRTSLSLAIAVMVLVACKEPPSARPDPAPSAAAQAPMAASAPSGSVSAERLQQADALASAALRARDRAKLKALAAPTFDVDRALQELNTTECLGAVTQQTGTETELLVRHTLGFEPGADGKCEGVHEIQMHYTIIQGEPKLASVNRWGW